MGPLKVPQALRWLENSTLNNESPKMCLQKALQALRWLEISTSKSQSPKMGLQKAPQALRWLKNSTLKTKVRTESGTHEVAVNPMGSYLTRKKPDAVGCLWTPS